MISKTLLSVLVLMATLNRCFADISSNEEVCLQTLRHSFTFAPNTPKPFVFFSMPKTGTNLLYRLLGKLTGRQPVWGWDAFPQVYEILDLDKRNEMFLDSWSVPLHWFMTPISKKKYREKLFELKKGKQFLFSHTPYSYELEKLLIGNKYVIFYTQRDPRDVVISLQNHAHRYRDFYFADWFYDLDHDGQVRQVILGTGWHNSVTHIVKEFYQWKDSPICCTINFEKLVGSRGGAYSDRDQLEELRKIANAIDLKISDKQLLKAFTETFGKGETFNQCKVGRWKDYFNEENKRLFKEVLGEELIEMGYESDYDW